MENGFSPDTSNRQNDSYCDLCADEIKVNAASYCEDCVQFMCNKCYKFHERLNTTRGHVVKTGTDMPRSQADKHPKFSHCVEHPIFFKDHFCSVHKQLICSLCIPLYHTNCSTGSVEDVSKSISSLETHNLYDTVSNIERGLETSLTAVVSNINDLNNQKRNMLQQAQELYSKIVSKAKKEFESEIDLHYHMQQLVLNQYLKKICSVSSKIKSSLKEIDTLRSQSIDTKRFLRIQAILSDMKQCKADLNAPIYRVQLSFVPPKEVKDFLLSSFTTCSVKLEESKIDITIPEILFPVSPTQQSLQLKHRTDVKLSDDRENCFITDIGITSDGRRLLVDHGNKKVKLVSRDMKLLSYLSLKDRPCGIAVLSDQEAVVATDNKSLVLLNISDRHMSIKKTITDLSYQVLGISQYGEKLVTLVKAKPSEAKPSEAKPPSVKLIDKTGGTEYWSVPTNTQGKSLFRCPQYVTSYVETDTITISDYWNNTLTVLNGDTGDVIKTRHLKDKYPSGVTIGPSGNIYVCYNQTREVAVLTGHLTEERTLLTAQDGLGFLPWAITYDKSCGQLIISYSPSSSECQSIDAWKLS